MDNKYRQTFEEFLTLNPELLPEWRDFIAPVVESEDHDMFAFIMSYIFM